MLEKNRTINEYEGSSRQRAIADNRLETKLANNRAIAAGFQRAGGPEVTASQETQPQPQRPRINIPG